jgi:Cu/Ag efflux protein CusF
MRTLFFAAAIGLITAMGLSPAFGQSSQSTQSGDPNITAKHAIGEVKTIDAATKQLTIKTDAGSVVNVSLSDKTTYKKLAPGETSLTNATDLTLTDLAEGDRVMARGNVSADQKSVPAAMVIVMTKGDLAKKQDAERAEWRRRGVLGVISALKPETKEITISHRTMAGTQTVVIPVTDKTEMRRYAPDSIKFGDAKPSEFNELKVGDQLRALGDRTEDPARFNPQKIVTGSFRTVAGVVTAIDAATGEIKINDLEKKKPLTIVIKQDAVLRKFPPASEIGAMMGGRGGGGPGGPGGTGGGAPAAGGGQPPQGGQGQAAAKPQGGAGPGAGGPGGQRPGGFDINNMLERLPTISLADVKVGDTIVVSSTQGVDPTRLTAISLVTGADTLLAMLAPRPQPGQTAPNPAAGLGSGISFGIGLP